eukprot:1846370-Prymnesium_polylepis.1
MLASTISHSNFTWRFISDSFSFTLICSSLRNSLAHARLAASSIRYHAVTPRKQRCHVMLVVGNFLTALSMPSRSLSVTVRKPSVILPSLCAPPAKIVELVAFSLIPLILSSANSHICAHQSDSVKQEARRQTNQRVSRACPAHAGGVCVCVEERERWAGEG